MDTIIWAEKRSRTGFVPEIVNREWLPAAEIQP